MAKCLFLYFQQFEKIFIIHRVRYGGNLYEYLILLIGGLLAGGIAGSWVNTYMCNDSFSLYLKIFIIFFAIISYLLH